MPWQPAAVEFPDIELLATTGLRSLLIERDEEGVYVGRSIPTSRRPRMVVVNRDGGDDDGITDRPRLRVRVWDTTPQRAIDLARKVAALIPLLAGFTAVTRTQKLSGPYEVPDASDGGTQMYLLFEIHTQPEGVLS